MTVLGISPCLLDAWVPDESCLKLPAGTTDAQKDLWQKMAVEILYARTGRQFGSSCDIRVRPCFGDCNGSDGYGWWFNGPVPLGYNGPFYPFRGADGEIRNWRGCGCGPRCHCGPELCQIQLPGPIFDINYVRIDGQVLSRNSYFSLDARYLTLNTQNFKADHPALADKYDDCWPRCQDFTKSTDKPLDDNQDNTFVIAYSTGTAVPAIGSAAVTELMNHFAGMCGGCGCGTEARQNLRSLSRQGVDLEFADPQQVFTDGRIGLPISDLFVQTYNPNKLPRPMRVLSPDSGLAGQPGRPRVELGYRAL